MRQAQNAFDRISLHAFGPAHLNGIADHNDSLLLDAYAYQEGSLQDRPSMSIIVNDILLQLDVINASFQEDNTPLPNTFLHAISYCIIMCIDMIHMETSKNKAATQNPYSCECAKYAAYCISLGLSMIYDGDIQCISQEVSLDASVRGFSHCVD